MHVFHDYISKQLHEHLNKRRVVIWYDANNEFVPYIEELLANSRGAFKKKGIENGIPVS